VLGWKGRVGGGVMNRGEVTPRKVSVSLLKVEMANSLWRPLDFGPKNELIVLKKAKNVRIAGAPWTNWPPFLATIFSCRPPR
jgi:hypothetical protein